MPGFFVRVIMRARLVAVAGLDRRVPLLGGPAGTVLVAGARNLVLLLGIVSVLARADIPTRAVRQVDVTGVVGGGEGERETEGSDDSGSFSRKLWNLLDG